jgi:NADPH:quinone reductase-like Zn-dependent oxidoreductase
VRSCRAPPAPSARRCSCSAGWPASSCGAPLAALIRELGATPIDYQHEDFARILPGGFDVVFDGIGEIGYRCSFAALKRRGLGLRLRLHGGRGGAAAPRHHFDVDRACVFMEAVAELVAGRQAPPHLLDKP